MPEPSGNPGRPNGPKYLTWFKFRYAIQEMIKLFEDAIRIEPSEFYRQNRVNWLRVKKGFIDRQTKYGKSIRYLNAFCLLAGSAADKTTTRALLNRIGDRWEQDLWVENKNFDGYKKWAFE